jgi:Spy/CpxP family protein refolding chaperone
MKLTSLFLLIAIVTTSIGSMNGQDQGKKEEAKKENPATKFKGRLPPNWGKLGLTDEQRQKVYKVHAKYKTEIDILNKKIQELEVLRDKERLEILTDEQKKRLQEILKTKSGG